MRRWWTLALMMMAMSAALAGPGTARGVVLGQVDDFEDGTTQGWMRGAVAPNPPSNIPGKFGTRHLTILSGRM